MPAREIGILYAVFVVVTLLWGLNRARRERAESEARFWRHMAERTQAVADGSLEHQRLHIRRCYLLESTSK